MDQQLKNIIVDWLLKPAHIALNERSLSNFPELINLQVKNGFKFLKGKSHKKTCVEFIDPLAEVIRSDIKKFYTAFVVFVLFFFSIAMDGFQPRYSKVVV